jgi:hypothetical protein
MYNGSMKSNSARSIAEGSRPKRAAIAGLVGLLLLGGCAGAGAVQSAGSSGAAPMAAMADAGLTTKPKRISFGLSAASKTTVSVVGGTPPYAVSQSDARIADVTAVAKSGGGWAFAITSVASGSTNVTVKDSKGATTVLSITQETCTPPTPEFGQIYPQAGAKDVSTRVGWVFMANPSSDPMLKYIPDFFVRLVGSDGSFVIGDPFKRTKETPPAGSASPPPASVISRGQFGKLKAGVTYQAYFPTAQSPCLPPQTTGSFTTKD